ncbi:MAG: 16S rRNA (adenine(1518)-N(6)/adenine(1519)-N(6))-dimethyltransferase RsmA [Kiritimatiellaeota bacterium]|nr:16S rRNA (adenine(1518)-N(6)/adenine(1519)-N(6))-dimethyltransferase RsmA [Kiritimatiellota bacterium]
MTSPKVIQELLARANLTPRHGLGQNFLIDHNILDHIVNAAKVTQADHVLEVGPGLGTLTQELLARAGKVTAVELDDGLYALLRERWGDEPRLALRHGDATELDHAALTAEGVTCLVSNLPYAVGTRVVVDAALQPVPPDRIVVLVQKEVAERFAAAPRTHAISPLSIWIQQCYTVSLVKLVKPSCFWPPPEVTSAVIRLERHDRFPLAHADRLRLHALTRQAFSQRRKQMANLFKSAPFAIPPERMKALLVHCGATPTARAEELSLSQWITLLKEMP